MKYIALASRKPAIAFPAIKGMIKTNVFGKKVLRGAEIAVTYRCQAHCSKCSCRTLVDGRRQEMTRGSIIAVCREMVGLGCIFINVTGGEPLLRADIADIVADLSRMPVIVSLATNGLLLDDALFERLKHAGLDVIQFGISSSSAAEHDRETGIEGSFDTLLSRIRRAKGLNIEVLLNVVVTKEVLNSRRLKDLAQIASENACFLSLVLPAQVGGWRHDPVMLDQKDYSLVKQWLKKKFITMDTETCYRKGICPAGTEKVYISPYGDLYPCPFIHHKSGNLLELSFSRLWKQMHQNQYHQCVNVRPATHGQ